MTVITIRAYGNIGSYMIFVWAFMKRSLSQSLPESYRSGSKFLFLNMS